MPSREEMLAGIREFQEWKKSHYETLFHEMAIMLSNDAGVAAELDRHHELVRALLFGPLAPSQFRLDGHGQREDADKEFAVAAATFGNITSPQLNDEQMAQLQMVSDAMKGDKTLAALVERFKRETAHR